MQVSYVIVRFSFLYTNVHSTAGKLAMVSDLLVFLLKVVDALLLVGNGLLSLPNLFFVPLS